MEYNIKKREGIFYLELLTMAGTVTLQFDKKEDMEDFISCLEKATEIEIME